MERSMKSKTHASASPDPKKTQEPKPLCRMKKIGPFCEIKVYKFRFVFTRSFREAPAGFIYVAASLVPIGTIQKWTSVLSRCGRITKPGRDAHKIQNEVPLDVLLRVGIPSKRSEGSGRN